METNGDKQDEYWGFLIEKQIVERKPRKIKMLKYSQLDKLSEVVK